ncbi:MAG TPA: PEP-CTERM sorting domain-containing protein [Pyrinomonadaceae bacterium]|nr:PEP-CTERM sorting domain-containing protein [Pyrinomonadaceae bacterium]
MNLHTPKGPRDSPRRWRAVRAYTAIALIVFLFTAGTAQADSVRIDKVVQTLSRYQGPADLRLSATQDPAPGQKTSTPTNGPRTDSPVTPASGETAKPDAGLPIVNDPPKLGVEIIEEAEVEGTICDCGEILIPDGGFPKWPLLFLAAVPLVFINECDDCDENPITQPTPTPPTPTPTPTPTPEPASLLLFGTGLLAVGAGLRRRRRNKNS